MNCGRPDRVASTHGFALFGVIVMLAAIIAVAFAIGPQILLGVTLSKEDDTRRQLELLVQSIIGVPGEPYGFVSDVGRLPKSLEELNTMSGTHTLCDAAFNPTIVADHLVDGATTHRGQVRMGWNGPYFKELFASGDYLVDAWGQRLQYTCPQTTKPATDPTTGGVALTLRTGQITSAGADGAFGTQDDIKSDQFHDNGHIFMTVTVGQSQATPQSLEVMLYRPINGEQASLSAGTATLDGAAGSEAVFVFPSVPAGVRFAEILLGPNQEKLHVQYDPNVANRRRYVVPIR